MSNSFYNSGKGKEVLRRFNKSLPVVLSSSLPTIKKVSASYSETSKLELEKVFVFGGGATIDFAKAFMAFHMLCVSQHNWPKLDVDIINQRLITLDPPRPLELNVVPTLAGSGSEVTKYATIWRDEVHFHNSPKSSISSSLIQPRNVLILEGASLTASLSSRISGALDALAHCIESYFSINANESSKDYSQRGISIALECLEADERDWSSTEHESKLFTLSMLGGKAINLTMTNACHALSYPITANFGVRHGYAVAASLVTYVQFAATYRNDLYLELEKQLNCSGFIGVLEGVIEKYRIRQMVQEACGSVEEFLSLRRAMYNPDRSGTCIFKTEQPFIDCVSQYLFNNE